MRNTTLKYNVFAVFPQLELSVNWP